MIDLSNNWPNHTVTHQALSDIIRSFMRFFFPGSIESQRVGGSSSNGFQQDMLRQWLDRCIISHPDCFSLGTCAHKDSCAFAKCPSLHFSMFCLSEECVNGLDSFDCAARI